MGGGGATTLLILYGLTFSHQQKWGGVGVGVGGRGWGTGHVGGRLLPESTPQGGLGSKYPFSLTQSHLFPSAERGWGGGVGRSGVWNNYPFSITWSHLFPSAEGGRLVPESSPPGWEK